MPLLVGLEFAVGTTDEDDARAPAAEGLFGGETYEEEDFCFFLLLLLLWLLVALEAVVVVVVVVVFTTRGKRMILSFFFLRIGRGGGGTVVMGIEVEIMLAPAPPPVLLPVLRAIFSDMWTCRTASLMML